ncbi:hypothetical protein [Haloarcula amylolytica]|uniref:hypothetical protein n=1 Tax=Haloarcula amylolytica TaxID=396317 RepID=UPI003C78BE73
MTATDTRPAADAPEDDRPALRALTTQQRDLLDELLDDDLDTRADILRWMQELSVHTLGQLGDGWFRHQVTDPTVVSAFIGRPWGPLRNEGVDKDWLLEFRRDIAAKDIVGALHASAREFRWSASEFHDYDDDDVDLSNVDPEDQHPGMRPSLGTLANRQRKALNVLLDGFEDPDHFIQWGQNAIRATYAEIGQDVIRAAYFDVQMREWLCGPAHGVAQFHRETWAAKYLFPGFNRSASKVASRSMEQPEESEQSGHIPH